MLKISSFVLLLLLAHTGLQAQALTVWPGDANDDGIANHVDLLHIGINYNSTGPARDSISNIWAPLPLLTAWSGGAPALPNPGYADCDGSGVIDSADVFALTQNYGRLHGGILPQDSGTLALNGAPILRLDILDSLQVSGTVTATLDILLGDSGNQVNGLYGVAFTITYDRNFVDQVLASVSGGWLNLDGNAQIIQHVDTTFGIIEIAIVRTDGFAVNGSGSLGSLGIVMDDNIRVSADFALPFGISYVRGMDAAGIDYYLQTRADTLQADFVTAAPRPKPLPGVQVYPVPARQVLYIRATQIADADLRVVDIRGVEMLRQHFQELNTHQLSVADWPAGVYFLEIRNKEGHCRAKVTVGAGE